MKYVIFGEKEELSQFPAGQPKVVLEDENGKTELRPVYLFWDKTDETVVQLYRRIAKWEAGGIGALAGRTFSAAVAKHMQNKYKEVFLSDPETLFLSEKAETEIPRDFWRFLPKRQEHLYLKYAKVQAEELFRSCRESVTFFCVLSPECRYEEIYDLLIMAEREAGARLADIFLLGEEQQKESAEEVLEDFYEESGLAGSFYDTCDCKKVMAGVRGSTFLLDYLGLTIKELGRPTFYVDGAGVCSGKEIHKMEGVCGACRSLRKHLDRAFLSAL